MLPDPSTNQPSHFKGKDAIGHVAEAQAKGLVSAAEIHGTEIPGPISAGADAARDTAFLLLLFSLFLELLVPNSPALFLLMTFSLGLLVFRTARSAWLGWFRLERLHRVLNQEKWEIEHNREQEREELKELYRAKGFQGELLENVIDVLMADGDRLLKVMVQEELGLSLENVEHPLKQGLGASIGVIAAALLCLFGQFLFGHYGLLAFSLLTIAISAAITAIYAKNKTIPALVWNLAFCIVAYGLIVFLFQAIG